MSKPRVPATGATMSNVVPPVVDAPPTAPVVRARWLLMGLFLLNGLMFSSWLARIPSVRDTLHLSAAELGVVLLFGSLGALVTAAVSGVLVTRAGGRFALLLSTGGFATAYLLIGLGPALGSVPLLAVGIFVNGVSFALGNVPLNVETAAVERRLGRTVLPQFHAAFSIGAVCGSALGALAAHAGMTLLVQFAATAVVGTVWRLLSVPHVVLESRPAPRTTALAATGTGLEADGTVRHLSARRGPGSALGAWREPRTLLIGVVIMAAALSEGSANDWLSLAVVDGFSRTEAVGATVFAIFVAAMTSVRLLGTRLIDTFGRVLVLRVSGSVSLVGLLVFGFAPRFDLAVVGVVCWGLGAALAVPIGIAAASDDPMRAAGRVSVVSAFSSVASLAAPPLLGGVAQSVGARHALVLISVAMVASIGLSRRVERVRVVAPAPAHAPAPAPAPLPAPVPVLAATSPTALVEAAADLPRSDKVTSC